MRLFFSLFFAWLTLVHAGTDCISPYVSSTVYSGLVGWYRMDEGSGTVTYNTMNTTGDPALMSTSLLQPGWAQTTSNVWNATYGKINGSVVVSAKGAVWILPGQIPVGFASSDFSLSMWYINDAQSGVYGWLFTMGMEGYGNPQLRVFLDQGFIKLCVGPWATSIITYARTTQMQTPWIWHHVVVTRTGTSYRFYLDNTLIGTVSSSVVLSTYDDGIRLTRGPGGDATCVTQIDEFMMWNRAISATEISVLYNTPSSTGFVFNPSTSTCSCPTGTTGLTACTSCSPSFTSGPGFAYGNSWITNNCSQCATGYYPTTTTKVNLTLDVVDMSTANNWISHTATSCKGHVFYISDDFETTFTITMKAQTTTTTRMIQIYNDTGTTGTGPWVKSYESQTYSYSPAPVTLTVVITPSFQLNRGKFYLLCETSPTAQGGAAYVNLNYRPISYQPGLTYLTTGSIDTGTLVATLTAESCSSLCKMYFMVPIFTKTVPLVCSTCEPSNVNSSVYIPNRYGASCAGTCACGMGTCYSGMSGNGTCVCNSGYSGTTTCVQCVVGKAGVGCADCTAGRFANVTGMTSCSACDAGKYSFSAASICTSCDVGRYSAANGAGDCLPCEIGKYVTTIGNTACTVCNPGSVALSIATTQCSICNAGKYSVDATIACVNCPTGSYSASSATSCIPCAPGTSAVNTSSSVCVACDAGTIAPNENTAECVPCDIGKYSFSATRCDNCQVGRFANSTGLPICNTCAMGTYIDTLGNNACVDCPVGRFYGGYGASVCSLCTPGTHSNITGRAYCSDCEPGWSISTQGAINCTACANGFFSDAYGFTSCLACNPGTYANHTGMTMCMLCEQGKFTNMNASGNCSTCPSGYDNFIPGAVNCTLIPTANLGISYTAQRNPNVTEPPVEEPRGSLLLALPIEIGSIVDMNRFMGILVFEIAKITNTSWELIFIKGVRSGSLIVDLLTPLTTAQILQQFVRPGLDPLVYPFLSQATSIEIQIIPAQMPANVYATYYDVECRNRNTSAVPCAGIGTCEKGICKCDACSVRTAAGPTPASYRCFATTDFPDVCESEYTTTEAINYEFTCASLGANWFNLFPKRRYCQHDAYPVGSYPNRYRAVWGRSPSLAVDFTRGLNGSYITPGYTSLVPARPTGIPYRTYDVYLLKELVSEAVYTIANSTLQTRYSGYAYVANLYEGENPIENKRLAWIVANYMYGVGTLQLVYLLFLPGIEGTAAYYWKNNQWNPKACGVNEYAVSAGSCECFEYHIRSLSGVCVPACQGGLAGRRCNEPCDLTWNKNTWLTYADCSRVECLNGYTGSACVTSSAYAFDSNNVNSYNTTEAPFWSIGAILALTGSLASVLGVGIAAWTCKSKHCSKRK